MRHYFGYDIEGNLISMETYGPIGWPGTHKLEDPECTEPSVVSLRERRARKSPEIVNWVAFDCDCDAAKGHQIQDCKCCSQKFGESMVDTATKTLVAKPLRTVHVDGAAISNLEIVTKAPGTVVNFKVVAAGMADGTKLKCIQKGHVDLTIDDEWEMTFTGGETEEKSLTTPAQGTRGAVHIFGPKIRPMSFVLRGFA